MIRVERPLRFILFIFVIFLAIGLAVFAAGRYAWGSNRLLKDGELVVEEGSSANAVWNQAVADGFSSSTVPWRYHAWRQNAAGKLKAGSYGLKANEEIPAVITRLINGEALPDDLTLTYPEGFTLDQIATRTASRGISSADEIIQNAQPGLLAAEFPFLNDVPAGRDLEGYLFPDTYQFNHESTAKDVIQRLVANFARRVTPQMRADITASGHSLDEIVIMASIIEREVQSDADMAIVSGILWKRLDEEIGLAADATIRYALAKWEGPLTVNDLAVDSPYNTRKYRGLPPGPISNPGLRALSAAIYPVSSEYYYYLSTPDGKTIFARTNDEHDANKSQYLR